MKPARPVPNARPAAASRPAAGIRITFLGAASEVTGSSYLVETASVRFLVDCGLFQGDRQADARNRRALSFDVKSLDFVVITHAHLDHSGLLPRLVGFGYRGPVYCTPATGDFLEPMLGDSAHLQESESQRLTRRARKQGLHREFAPLYTVQQAHDCLRRLQRRPYLAPFAGHDDVELVLRDTGHILGAASLEARVRHDGGQTRLLFSGDVGMPGRPLINDPVRPTEADVLLVESTYGNRNHRSLAATYDELALAINETRERAGNVIVPAFALGRTQELLVVLLQLLRDQRIGPAQVFIDSPLARKATEITWHHMSDLDQQSRELLAAWRRGDLPLELHEVDTPDDSRALNRIRSGAIIIAGSGMCDGGRVRHHLIQNLPRAECAVVFCGFQAAGTLGRRIVDGQPHVRILGEEVTVRARRYTLGGLSSHADRDGLLDWLSGLAAAPRRTFVVHGEAETALAFAQTLRERRGWSGVEVPESGLTVVL